MNHRFLKELQQFKNEVGTKFLLYNSLFTSLPFQRIENTGILLSLLLSNCEDGYTNQLNPKQIIEQFFKKHTTEYEQQENLGLLFRFIQYIERQVVLFDALEDASFRLINDFSGVGTLKQLESEIILSNKKEELKDRIKNFAIRLVLTAHPTQFYPGPVLGIINDLSKALADNNTSQVNMYLQQLGKTPFFKKQKPTPYDEAVNLIWYLENVFYSATGKIISFFKTQFPDAINDKHPLINMGFWPGGDRDGNPFVNAETTQQVAAALRSSIIKCYYLEIRKLKRRLTFEGIDIILNELEKKLYNNVFIPGYLSLITKQEILDSLIEIKKIIIEKHNGLFLYLVENLLNKVNVFGLHFASLDIRQESSIHGRVLDFIAVNANALPDNYINLSENDKIEILSTNKNKIEKIESSDAVINDTIASIKAIRSIQHLNGVNGCNRYIISQCNSALNVMEVYGLFLLAGWQQENIFVDIVPLFETINDLHNAVSVMKVLYENKSYANHLQRRNKTQTIMLGFSDGTKDGGYLMANWSIYKAKQELTAISKKYNIEVIFFDGRGGPPSRGGGKTHKFYASLGKDISNKEIQLTIQGQTVSSNFGNVDAAQFNMEQLLNAGITNNLFSSRKISMNKKEELLVEELANYSYDKYSLLKNHPLFTEYLSQISPLNFYSETNIGSRPAKRNADKLTLNSLRAIPYVGAWAQTKQNVTGFFGVGTALQKIEQVGKFQDVTQLYQSSLYFKTLLDNCEMVMKKCFFPLTEFLKDDKKYAEIWNTIHEEYLLTKKYLLLLSAEKNLMDDYPVDQLSITMRERIILPLLTIQQFALINLREIQDNNTDATFKETYQKLVVRSSFGIINAGRNSA